jgi:hypothetical protein
LNTEKLIGRVAVEWPRLEGVMEDFIWHFLGLPIETGRIVTGRLDATAKIRMLRALGELKLPEQRWHVLSSILDKIDMLREERNIMVHGTWGRNPGGVPIAISLRIRALAPDQVVSETFPAERMQGIAHDTVAAKLRLMRLMKGLGALPDIPIPPHPEE